MLAFYRHVDVDKELRDAGREARVATDGAEIERKIRVDLHEVSKEARTKAVGVVGEDRNFADKLLTEGKRNGLELAEEQRTELVSLRKELSALCVAVQRQSNEGTHDCQCLGNFMADAVL